MNQNNRSWRHLVIAAIHLSLAAFFGYAFHDRFWAWRHEIAEVNTSYLTPDGANVTSGGMLWVFPAFIFALLFAVRIYRYAVPIHRAPK
jgi:hypothetical protein